MDFGYKNRDICVSESVSLNKKKCMMDLTKSLGIKRSEEFKTEV